MIKKYLLSKYLSSIMKSDNEFHQNKTTYIIAHTIKINPAKSQAYFKILFAFIRKFIRVLSRFLFSSCIFFSISLNQRKKSAFNQLLLNKFFLILDIKFCKSVLFNLDFFNIISISLIAILLCSFIPGAEIANLNRLFSIK